MIDFFGLPTPNCWKTSIALEELGLDYRYTRISIGDGDQFEAEFDRLSPNNKIPLIIDHAPLDRGEPQRVFESDAILLYLAEKTGQLLPRQGRNRFEVIQWLFWDASNVGEPHSTRLAFIAEPGSPGSITKKGAEPNTMAADFLAGKIRDLYKQLEKQLSGKDYLCGEYSIADIAVLGHVIPRRVYEVIEDLSEFPNTQRWYQSLRARPAVQRGLALDEEMLATIVDEFRIPFLDQ
ncbi:MAG: glutathione S-transferase N-terminal domain-containing protein [Deltaproteobacteria bacterium]|nr:glutathione S-transferase N-terminal domain-containing protein [Deltaproteobacteria bacterium]MBW2359693.1 glutathione S-transferase N-terminal domain-containing protein [Deltaproteobacteria bacterium]